MCVPQKRYEKGADRNPVLFNRQDGSYIPVPAAMAGDYTNLTRRDLQVLGEAGFTIALQFEVSGSSRPQ